MSSHRSGFDKGDWRSDRPTLPPIRDLFRDELSRSPRSYNPTDSPSYSLSQLRVNDDDDGRSAESRPRHTRPDFQSSSSGPFIVPGSSPHTPRPYAAMSHGAHLLPDLRSRSSPDVMNRNGIPSNFPIPRCNSYESREPRTHHHPGGVADFGRGDNPYNSRSSRYPQDDRSSVARYHESGQSYANARFSSRPEASNLTTSVDRPASDQRIADYSGTVSRGIPNGGDYPGSEAPGNTSPTSKYDCNYCGKGFNRPSSLKIHLNSHTGEKPFVCPVESCGRSFSVLSNMRRHARVHAQRPLVEQEDSSEEGSDTAASTSKSQHGRQHSSASSGSSDHTRNR